MLVSTDDGASFLTLASGGADSESNGLTGSQPIVEVVEVSKGQIPMSHIVASLKSTKTYYARVRAHNRIGASKWTMAKFSVIPQKRVPTAARNVLASIVSKTAIGISWKMPLHEGGDSVSKYSIQWDTNSNFGPTAQTSIFSNLTSGSPYNYVIRGLTTNTQYYIRVLSYNSYGYGPPAHALIPRDHREIQVVSLAANATIRQGQFRLSYRPSNSYGSLPIQYTNVIA
jgi:hypothetical protein